MSKRLSTGIPDLDRILGGGLIPGKKVVVYGATGVGKSVLGVTLAYAGIKQENHPGVIIDISTGADEQSQLEYARMFGWGLRDWSKVDEKTTPQELSDSAYRRMQLKEYTVPYKDGGDDMQVVFDYFFRHHLPRTRRLIIDGSEPYESAKGANVIREFRDFLVECADSREVIIFRNGNSFSKLSPIDNEGYWHWAVSDEQIDAFFNGKRDKFRFGWDYHHGTEEERAAADPLGEDDPHNLGYVAHNRTFLVEYLKPQGPLPINMRSQPVDTSDNMVVLLQTTTERNIVDLANRPIEIGSLDAEVNTVLVMGYLPVSTDNLQQRRALAVIKHRGSNYDATVVEYKITDKGMVIGK